MEENEIIFYEIAFFPTNGTRPSESFARGGTSLSNKVKISLQTYDNIIAAKAALCEVAKNYLVSAITSKQVKIVTTLATTTNDPIPDIKYNHKIYPVDSLVLIKRNDAYTVYEKKSVINTGYIYNSESFKVNVLGTIAITQVKLSHCLTEHINYLKNLENETKKTVELMQEREKLINLRESHLSQREKMLNDWDTDLEEWELVLEKKSNELNELSHHHVNSPPQGWVPQTDVPTRAELSEVGSGWVPHEIHSESEEEFDTPVKPKQPTPAKGPIGYYMDELKDFLMKWDKPDDDTYFKHIEKTINPGKKKVVFGKVKDD